MRRDIGEENGICPESQDAMGVARNVVADPRLVPGGGAAEMAVSRGLKDRAAAIKGAGGNHSVSRLLFPPFFSLSSVQKGKPGAELLFPR